MMLKKLLHIFWNFENSVKTKNLELNLEHSLFQNYNKYWNKKKRKFGIKLGGKFGT